MPTTSWTGRARDLVKLLALTPGRRLPRERAVECLWPQLDAEAGLSNLHKAAHHARRALGDTGAVVLREGKVALAPEARVETDVERFEATGDPELYGGDLLSDDRYADWAEERRSQLRRRYLDGLRAAGRKRATRSSQRSRRDQLRPSCSHKPRIDSERSIERV